MTSRTKAELLEIVLRSLADSGWEGSVLAEGHPFEIEARRGGERRRLHVYIWNVTHGGGPRSEEEYRIQITGAAGAITAPPGAQVLLLGWHDDHEVFAAFDPVLHRRLGTAKSLSLSHRR